MTWMDDARAAIASAHRDMPADADLATRKRVLRQACPNMFRNTSWGRKVWPKAVAEYLKPYGYKFQSAVPKQHLSPLERMMVASRRREERT